MIYMFASYLLWLLSLLGLGIAAFRSLHRSPADRDPAHLLVVTLLGMSALGTLCNILNFFTPVNPIIALILLFSGWILLIVNRHHLRELLSSTWPYKPWALGLLVLSLLLWTAFLSRQARDLPHDSGLYHLQAIKWITHSQLPFGLANLHGRLGFNSMWFSVAAALEVPWLEGRSSFIANALPFAMYGSAVGAALLSAITFRLQLSSTFLISSGVAWISMSRDDFTRDATVGSASPDLPVAFLALLSTYLSIRALESKRDWDYYIGVGFLVAVFSVTIKLSSLPLLAWPLATLCWIWYKHRCRAATTPPVSGRTAIPSLGFVLVLLAPWLLRGIFTSGCLAYPAPWGTLEVLEWTVPASQIQSERLWIMSWARQPGASPDVVLSSWNWLSPWLSRMVSTWTFKQIASLLVVGLVLWIISGNRNLRGEIEIYAIPALASLVAVIYWFMTAPDLRFGQGFLWSAATLAFSSGVSRLRASYAPTKAAGAERAALSLSAIVILALAHFTSTTYFEPPGPRMMHSWPVVPELPSEKARVEFTKGGIPVHIPKSGGQCWDYTLPCAPSLTPNLEVLRDEHGQLRGFRVDRQ